MQVPSILKAPSLTRLLQGIALGAAATMVIGFYWGDGRSEALQSKWPAKKANSGAAEKAFKTNLWIPTIPARDSNLKAATIPIEGGQYWPVGTFMGSQRW